MAKEPGSPKKRKEAEPPAAAAAAAMAEQQPGGGKKRRRGKKSKGVGDEANLPRDELERRCEVWRWAAGSAVWPAADARRSFVLQPPTSCRAP